MKPEDALVTDLLATVDRHDSLRTALWRFFLGPSPSLPTMGSFEGHPDYPGGSNPDILLRASDGRLLAYVEAKLSADTQLLQLFRGRSWARREAARTVPIILLANHRDEIPSAVGTSAPPDWFRTLLWCHLFAALRASEVAPGRGATKARADLAALTARAAALGVHFSPPPPKLVKRLDPPSRFAYVAVFDELRHQAAPHGYECDFVYGDSSPPRLMVGHPDWARIFGAGEWQRLIIGYGLPRYTGIKFERFALNLQLWNDGDLADIRSETEHLRLGWLSAACAHGPANLVEIGRREHAKRSRVSGTAIPPRAATSYIGLCRFRGLQLKETECRSWPSTRTASELLRRLERISRFVASLA